MWWEIKRKEPRDSAAAKQRGNWHDVAPARIVERMTSFANPVLQHETRGRLRMRRPPQAVIVSEVLMAAGVALIYAFLFLAAWLQPTGSILGRFLQGVSGFELSLRETIWRR